MAVLLTIDGRTLELAGEKNADEVELSFATGLLRARISTASSQGERRRISVTSSLLASSGSLLKRESR